MHILGTSQNAYRVAWIPKGVLEDDLRDCVRGCEGGATRPAPGLPPWFWVVCPGSIAHDLHRFEAILLEFSEGVMKRQFLGS